MTAKYDPAEIDRLLASPRADGGAMADQLEAARAEVTWWRADSDRLAKAANKNMVEVDRLRAQNRSLCEALADAQAGMHSARQRCRTVGEITDEALGLLFGLLANTGPDRMNINDRRVLIQVAERLQRVQREASK